MKHGFQFEEDEEVKFRSQIERMEGNVRNMRQLCSHLSGRGDRTYRQSVFARIEVLHE